MVEFADGLEITNMMGAHAREIEDYIPSLVIQRLDAAAASGMPVDPRVWHHDGVRSTYPACIAFRAAAEQGADAASRYLRVLREGFMCHGRKLDGPEALVTEARRAGLDAQRFRIDLESNAILEAFAGDLEETRTIPDGAREAGLATEGSHGSSVERLAFPALRLIPDGDGLDEHWARGRDRSGGHPVGRASSRRGRSARAIRKHGHRGARGGVRPPGAPGGGGRVAPRERVAGAARAGPELRALGACLALRAR